MMAASTPDLVGSNSFPVMFQGLAGSISFPMAVPCKEICLQQMTRGKIKDLCHDFINDVVAVHGHGGVILLAGHLSFANCCEALVFLSW